MERMSTDPIRQSANPPIRHIRHIRGLVPAEMVQKVSPSYAVFIFAGSVSERLSWIMARSAL
jgi:hypothetical protein